MAKAIEMLNEEEHLCCDSLGCRLGLSGSTPNPEPYTLNRVLGAHLLPKRINPKPEAKVPKAGDPSAHVERQPKRKDILGYGV